jgi:hypothetical protein
MDGSDMIIGPPFGAGSFLGEPMTPLSAESAARTVVRPADDAVDAPSADRWRGRSSRADRSVRGYAPRRALGAERSPAGRPAGGDFRRLVR